METERRCPMVSTRREWGAQLASSDSAQLLDHTILSHNTTLQLWNNPVLSLMGTTALLQHTIQFLLLSKIVPPYTASSATSSPTSLPSSLTINIPRPATWRLPAPPIHDYVHVIEFLLIIITIITTYFISISKTNDDNNAPEQPIDMRMKKDNKAKV